jgi:hypothetical protein
MNEQQLRELFQKGFDNNLKPLIETMSETMMKCYEQGFKDCWKILIGKNFDNE